MFVSVFKELDDEDDEYVEESAVAPRAMELSLGKTVGRSVEGACSIALFAESFFRPADPVNTRRLRD